MGSRQGQDEGSAYESQEVDSIDCHSSHRVSGDGDGDGDRDGDGDGDGDGCEW